MQALRGAFIEFFQRPFRYRHGIEDRLTEVGAAQRVQTGVGGGPENVAVPFDENIVDGAVVAAKYFEVATLRRNGISDFLVTIQISDIVAAQSGEEVGVGDEIVAWLAGGFGVRGV